MTTPHTTPTVTPEQLDACMRCIAPDGEVFYRVKSATDPLSDGYTVKAIAVNGKHHLTCTCKARQSGTPCWHKRAARAHADEWFSTQEAMGEREAAEEAAKREKLAKIRRLVEKGLTHPQALEAVESYTTLTEDELVRVFKAPVRKGPKPNNDTRVFSLMR